MRQTSSTEENISSSTVSVSKENASETWKKLSLVGKMWEVFWSPEPRELETLSRTPPSPTSTNVYTEGDEYAFDADWYDARINSYLPDRDMFEVTFVGEDKIHIMSLNPKLVRPLDAANFDYYEPMRDKYDFDSKSDTSASNPRMNRQQNLDLKWCEDIVGKDVEIFWEESNVDTSTEDDRNFKENHDYCSDWYDASIESFDSVTGMFKVSFLGDDQLYEMILTQEQVRPSVRAWIKRANDVLNLSVEQVMNLQAQNMYMERLYGMPLHDNRDRENLSSKDEIDQMKVLLQELLLLLPSLEFSSCDDSNDNIPVKKSEQFSKTHVEILEKRIQIATDACQWYSRHNWNTFEKEILDIQNTPMKGEYPPKISIQELYSSILDGTKLFLKTLLFDSCDKDRFRSKRTRNEAIDKTSQSSSNRSKRRRLLDKSKYGVVSVVGNEGIDREKLIVHIAACENSDDDSLWHKVFSCWNDNVNEQDSWPVRPGTVNFLLRSFSHGKKSAQYLSSKLCDSIETLLHRVLTPTMQWIQNAIRAVGVGFATDIKQMQYFLQGHDDDSANDETKCSLEDIKKCLEFANHNSLLRKIDLIKYKSFLTDRMIDINMFQNEAWDIIFNCMNDDICLTNAGTNNTRTALEENDATLRKFYTLLNHPACPRSTDLQQSPHHLTETTIEDAIKFRKWIILCKWIESKRERKKLVEEALRQKPESKLSLPTKYINCLPYECFIQRMGDMLAGSTKIAVTSIDWETLTSASCCQSIMRQISASNILDENEEKLALMSDLLVWNTQAIAILSRKCDFEKVESIYKTLQELKKGQSKSRIALTNMLLEDKETDTSIATFAVHLISSRFHESDKFVNEVFHSGLSWSKRAKLVIQTLKHHGNDALSTCNIRNVASKPFTVIELKTIDELVREHDNSLFEFNDVAKYLYKARDDAYEWVRACVSCLPNEVPKSICPASLQQSLQEIIMTRPKGITMFPSRQLMNELIRMLKWFNDCTVLFDEIRTCIASEETISEVLIEKVEKQLYYGADIVHASPTQFNTYAKCDFNVNLSNIKVNFDFTCESAFNRIPLHRIESCHCSLNLLRSLLHYDYQMGVRGTLFNLKLFVWKDAASNYLKRAKDYRSVKCTKPLSMEYAKQILDSLILPEALEKLSSQDSILGYLYSTVYTPLESLFQEAQKVYNEVLEVCKQVNSTTQAITERYIGTLVEKLKEVRCSIKALNEDGIGFDADLSLDIDNYIRELQWVKSTFDYSFIREGAKINYSLRGVNSNGIPPEHINTSKRISQSIITNMYQKAPARCRVKECKAELDYEMKALYSCIMNINNQISEWRDEVHNYMPWILRMSKRRDIKSRYLTTQVSKDYDVVTEADLRKFLHHPLLTCVSLPEEEVIREALLFTTSMRDRLLIIFGIDHQGFDTDRFALPTRTSLIGDSGEFYLYRVTQGSAFLKLKMEIDGMKSYANSLPLRTVDKLTYSWLEKVVVWVERVAEAVFLSGPPLNKLCISTADAQALIKEGHQVFFGLPDESRKYLLHHRLSVNSRESTGNVYVKNCKGGSNYSIGCSVLRWAAFCYNGLRNDLVSTEVWSNKMHQATDVDTICKLLDEANCNLVVAPDTDVSRITNQHVPHTAEDEVIVHNLLRRRANQV